MRPSLHVVFPLLISIIILYPCDSCLSQEEWCLIKRAVDGDTIVASDGRRIRYIGVNSPETRHFKGGAIIEKAEPFGDAAKQYNDALVRSQNVRLVFDTERYDRYGRLLAYVFLEDDSLVNEAIVREGLGFCLPIAPNLTYVPRLLRAQRGAMAQRKNIWRSIADKQRQVLGNKKTMRFHRPSCRYGQKMLQKNRVVFETVYNAFYMGFAPCMKCKPHR